MTLKEREADIISVFWVVKWSFYEVKQNISCLDQWNSKTSLTSNIIFLLPLQSLSTHLFPPWPGCVPLSPLLTFPMTAAGGIDAKADISVNMKIYFLLLFSPIPLSLPPPSSCCSSSLIREGVLTSPAAEVWPTGWLGDLKALLGMHCPWAYVYVCVYILPTPQFLQAGGGLCVW